MLTSKNSMNPIASPPSSKQRDYYFSPSSALTPTVYPIPRRLQNNTVDLQPYMSQRSPQQSPNAFALPAATHQREAGSFEKKRDQPMSGGYQTSQVPTSPGSPTITKRKRNLANGSQKIFTFAPISNPMETSRAQSPRTKIALYEEPASSFVGSPKSRSIKTFHENNNANVNYSNNLEVVNNESLVKQSTSFKGSSPASSTRKIPADQQRAFVPVQDSYYQREPLSQAQMIGANGSNVHKTKIIMRDFSGSRISVISRLIAKKSGDIPAEQQNQQQNAFQHQRNSPNNRSNEGLTAYHNSPSARKISTTNDAVVLKPSPSQPLLAQSQVMRASPPSRNQSRSPGRKEETQEQLQQQLLQGQQQQPPVEYLLEKYKTFFARGAASPSKDNQQQQQQQQQHQQQVKGISLHIQQQQPQEYFVKPTGASSPRRQGSNGRKEEQIQEQGREQLAQIRAKNLVEETSRENLHKTARNFSQESKNGVAVHQFNPSNASAKLANINHTVINHPFAPTQNISRVLYPAAGPSATTANSLSPNSRINVQKQPQQLQPNMNVGKIYDKRGSNSSQSTATSLQSSQTQSCERKLHFEEVKFLNELAKGQPVIDDFIFLKVLGHGSYAVVRSAVYRKTNFPVAIKSYDKKKLADPQKKQNVEREVSILLNVNHKNIIRLYKVVECEECVHLIMEYTPCEAMSTYLKERPHRKVQEIEARAIFRQLVEATLYLHRRRIIHRDIKLENILIDADRNVKLIDFGFSIVLDHPSQKVNVFCGTPSYMAPEIILKTGYSFEVDIWALGILLNKILTANFPFTGNSDKSLYRNITKGKVEYPIYLSSIAKDLIAAMLRDDPQERIAVKEILQDEWLEFR